MNSYLSILAFSVLFLFACADECKDVNCENGACVEGICECETGWEGELCEIKENAKFVGTWNGELVCTDLVEEKISRVMVEGNSPKEIVMINNAEPSESDTAVINGLSFEFSDKTLIDEDLGPILFSSKGYLNEEKNKLTIIHKIEIMAWNHSTECIFTGIK